MSFWSLSESLCTEVDMLYILPFRSKRYMVVWYFSPMMKVIFRESCPLGIVVQGEIGGIAVLGLRWKEVVGDVFRRRLFF